MEARKIRPKMASAEKRISSFFAQNNNQLDFWIMDVQSSKISHSKFSVFYYVYCFIVCIWDYSGLKCPKIALECTPLTCCRVSSPPTASSPVSVKFSRFLRLRIVLNYVRFLTLCCWNTLTLFTTWELQKKKQPQLVGTLRSAINEQVPHHFWEAHLFRCTERQSQSPNTTTTALQPLHHQHHTAD